MFFGEYFHQCDQKFRLRMPSKFKSDIANGCYITKGNDGCLMIFTAHETGLLNLDLFRRDQIWFTEMRQKDRSTNLYSLAEIKNVRKEENFEKGYVSGKYGAIPMLNLNFADIVSKE